MSAEISPADAAPAPFTIVTGDPAAMVCEGEACYVPAAPTIE